ncbi:MAG: phytoene/squalene synthase family protein [Pseudomonadota bacterium]
MGDLPDTDLLAAEILTRHGEETIAKGSKSFALASRLFRPTMRDHVRMLYAWCRHCDDVIDGQDLGGDAPDADLSAEEQAARLDALRRFTRAALAGTPTGHPAFDGFSLVARAHEMPAQYPLDLLDGFAMDVARQSYDSLDDTLEYCYGVAGVVGVMMAIVMGVRADDHAVLDRACDLGLAFQLTNICRDVADDARAGRVYLPAAHLCAHGVEPTAQGILDLDNRAALAGAVSEILDIADLYYRSATAGIAFLPTRAAAAIAAARNIYRDIGRLIRARGAAAWDQRAYTSKRQKTWLALKGCAEAVPHRLRAPAALPPSRDGLWSRPVSRPIAQPIVKPVGAAHSPTR